MVYWNITQVVILLFLFSFPFHITSIPTPCNYTFGSIEHITYWPLYVAWQHHGLTLFLLFYIFCFFTPPFSILTHKHTYIYSNVLRWLFSQISITFILVLLSFFLLEFHSVSRSLTYSFCITWISNKWGYAIEEARGVVLGTESWSIIWILYSYTHEAKWCMHM